MKLSYSYDALGRVASETSSDGTVAYTYAYDSLSRLILVCDLIHNTQTEQRYDARGNRVFEKLATGLTTYYQYDTLQRMTQIASEGLDPIDYTYDAAFLRTVEWRHHRVDYPAYSLSGQLLNGAGIDYHYDQAERLLNWKTAGWEENYRYDLADQLIGRERQGELTDYTFDLLGQLTEERGAERFTYSYDSLYNRRTKNDSECRLNSLNQLLSCHDTTYEWDRNGNLTAQIKEGVKTEFVYDARDRLIGIKGGTTYFWDDQNRRLKKDDQLTLYQGSNEVGTVENGAVTEFRVLGLGRGAEIGASVFIELQGEVYKPLHDGSGNLIALLTNEGKLAERYSFSAFGEEGSPAVLSPWRFCSKRHDPETGFILFGRRLYDPVSGRFITSDPLGYEGGPNLYAYAQNCPLTRFDLFGLNTDPSSPLIDPTQEKSQSYKERAHEVAKTVEEIAKKSFDAAQKGVRSVVSHIGTGIKVAGRESLPRIPYVSDLSMGFGHLLENGTLNDYTPSWEQGVSEWKTYGTKPLPEGIIIAFSTGMQTSDSDADIMGARLAALHNDHQVLLFKPGSYNFTMDSGGSALDYNRIPTEAYQKFKEGADQYAEKSRPYRHTLFVNPQSWLHSRAQYSRGLVS